MPGRPDDETLRLLLDVVDEVGMNEAIFAGGTLFQLKMSLIPTHDWTVVEPPPTVLRHLLDRLRQLDMPSSDVRLDRVYPIIDRIGVLPGWAEHVAAAKRDYLESQEVRNVKVQDPDEPPISDPSITPTWITPREAFGLWAYGGVIHNDYRKEQRWKRMGVLVQASVREMAHEYTMTLIDQAEFMTRLLRYGLAKPLVPAKPSPR